MPMLLTHLMNWNEFAEVVPTCFLHVVDLSALPDHAVLTSDELAFES